MRKKWPLLIGSSLIILGLIACANNNESLSKHKPNPNDLEAKEKKPSVPTKKNDQQKDSNTDENETKSYTIDINSDHSITALVNKQHSLQEDYEPEDLVTIDVPTILENPEVNQLRVEAADALKEMFTVAQAINIQLHARSGYRSHHTQAMLFDNYAKEHGEEAANRYSARPGQSEHQTGLVMDITSESVNYQLVEEFGETEEGKWLQDYAHEFGFIIRYPKDKEEITGYIYEPWHLRYLGVDVATAVYESGLTYEEFLVEEGIIDEINP